LILCEFIDYAQFFRTRCIYHTYVPSIFLCSLVLFSEDVIRSSTMHQTVHHLSFYACFIYICLFLSFQPIIGDFAAQSHQDFLFSLVLINLFITSWDKFVTTMLAKLLCTKHLVLKFFQDLPVIGEGTNLFHNILSTFRSDDLIVLHFYFLKICIY